MSTMSSVWKFFDKSPEDESKAVCKLCGSVLSRGGKNTKSYGTSTLMKHLRLKHAHEWGEEENNTGTSSQINQQILAQCLEVKLWDTNNSEDNDAYENQDDDVASATDEQLDNSCQDSLVIPDVQENRDSIAAKHLKNKQNHPKKRKTNSEASILNSVISKISKLTEKKREDDEFDAFCKLIAIQLRQMPLNNAIICQDKIYDIVRKQRFELLFGESQQPTTSSSFNDFPSWTCPTDDLPEQKVNIQNNE